MSAEMIDSAASPFLARDRLLRAQALRMSPAERLAAMRRLLTQSRAILESHPEGLDHFRRRNFAARSIGRKGEANTDDS
jgi:hypothetical protein